MENGALLEVTRVSGVALASVLAACTVGASSSQFEPRSLEPVDEFRESGYIERLRPRALELSADEAILFVSLAGDLLTPKHEVLALNSTTGEVLAHIEVGSSPQGMALSDDGSLLYVANQFSNFLSVVDVEGLREVGKIPATYYAQDLAVDGANLYVSNRWLDAVERIELTPDGQSGSVTARIPAAPNPRDIAIGPGGMLIVGSVMGTCLVVIDPTRDAQVDSLFTNSPVMGVASDGQFVYLATLGRGDGHPATAGISAETGATYRGDGTASLAFSDINNDVGVVQLNGDKLEWVSRYTSDTAEVSARDARGDYDPAELIVEGALPEQVWVSGQRIYVSMSASDSIQVFDVAEDGSLTSATVLDTGINPFEVVATRDNSVVFSADHLGDTVSRIRVADNQRTEFSLGSAPAYPATSYEIGEMLFHSARVSVEAIPSEVHPEGDKAGDMSCSHCHIENLSDGKVWSVGIGEVVFLGGQRMAPAARNLRDTMPLFWEGTQDEHDFDLEGNGFVPAEDFGCDREATEERPSLCAARDDFLRAQAGYTFEEIYGEFFPAFLIGRPRLLPNPLAQAPLSQAGGSDRTWSSALRICRGRLCALPPQRWPGFHKQPDH